MRYPFSLLLFLATACCIQCPLSLEASIEWKTDYKQALAQSQSEEKKLLLFFTGSDWSGLSMQMKNEILNSRAFQDIIQSKLICVEVDFPQHLPIVQEKLEQNMTLKERFLVTEYPSLLLLDTNEREISRLGYFPESGEQLAHDLVHIIEQDKKLITGLLSVREKHVGDVQQLRQLYQIAIELNRKDAIEEILAKGFQTADPFFQLEKYRLLVEEGHMQAPEALCLRAQLLRKNNAEIHFTLALIEFQELSKESSKMQDLKAIIKPLEDYLTHFRDQDTENVWRVEMMIAQFYLELDEWRAAIKHAQVAYQTAPQSMRSEIEHSLNYIRDQALKTAQSESPVQPMQ